MTTIYAVVFRVHRPPSPREVMRALIPGRDMLRDPEGNAGFQVSGEPEPQGDGEPTPVPGPVWVPLDVAVQAHLRLACGGTLD